MFEWLFKTEKKLGTESSAPEPSRSPSPNTEDNTNARSRTTHLGLQHHQAGRLSEAEAAYREVLAVDPDNLDALHFLGVIAYQLGKHEQAAELISQALSRNASNAPAQNNLGNVFIAQAKLTEAIACYQKALALQPAYVDAHVNLGAVFRTQGKPEDAVACYRRALSLAPDFPTTYLKLGDVLHDEGKLEEAIACYQRALSLAPDDPAVHFKLGNVVGAQGKLTEAIAHYGKSLALKPDFAEAHSNLGNALNDQGKSDEAIACHRTALALKPDLSEAHFSLGNALLALGRLGEAEAAYRQGLMLQPDSANAKLSYALLKLLQGDYESGLPLYESRFEDKALSGLYAVLRDRSARLRETPRWLGENVAGRALLVWTDQGLGDSLMTLRYLPLVKGRGIGRLIVYCEPELVRVVQTIAGVDDVVPAIQPMPFGEFDYHCPIMSLPLHFDTRIETIPARVPYLFVPNKLKQEWAQKLTGIAPFKIGLVWASGDLYPKKALRNVQLEQFSPLFRIADVNFVSLQKGEGVNQLGEAGWNVLDWMDECNDLLDTAALIEQLDLVISVDTAVAHLAGALGKPVWMLNRFESEWRWMLEREDSPWYPTMKIFRQSKPGDWGGVIVRVASALTLHSHSKR